MLINSVKQLINQLIQTKSGEFVELGLGLMFISDFTGNNRYFYENYPIFRIGYRFQNPKKRFMTNISYTPIKDNYRFYHLAGVGLGYRL